MDRHTKWLAVLLMVSMCWLLNVGRLRAQGSSPPPPTVQFASGYYVVNENAGTVTLTVTLSIPMSSVVTVNYATGDGTAVAGTDYAASSGTVTFPANVTSQTISVGVIDNGSYTDQAVYFTVTLSNPSPNVILGTVIVAMVELLDNDPAPTVDIEISGVVNLPLGQKTNPGGFVVVNANNDNGSDLTFADGTTLVPKDWTGKPLISGIPKKRDYSLAGADLPLAVADPDLIQITLATTGLKIPGPEKIVLSMTTVPGFRAKFSLWDTGKKNTKIALPTNWTAPTPPPAAAGSMPPSVYVEGILEGAALREITLQLQILNRGVVVSTDSCTLTVTPVLTDDGGLLKPFEVDVATGAVPDISLNPKRGWVIQSSAGIAGETMAAVTTAQWNQVRGKLRFIQNVKNVNNLESGEAGADSGPGRKWDFAAPNAGNWMVDSLLPPFFTVLEKQIALPNNVATTLVNDSPALPLSQGRRIKIWP